MKKWALIIVFMAFMVDILCFAEDNALVLTPSGNGGYKATIVVTGRAKMFQSDEISYEKKKLMAKRAATVDGYRKILEILNAAKTYISKNGEKIIEVNGYLNGVEIYETRYYSNGWVEVDLKLNLDVYDPNIENDEKIKKIFKNLRGKSGAKIIEVDKTKESVDIEEIYNKN